MSKERDAIEAASRGATSGMQKVIEEARQRTAAAPAIDPAKFWETWCRGEEARRIALAMAEIDALNDEIMRVYSSIKPAKWQRYPMSHLCFHRKRRIREKWRKRLRCGPWIKLAPGAIVIEREEPRATANDLGGGGQAMGRDAAASRVSTAGRHPRSPRASGRRDGTGAVQAVEEENVTDESIIDAYKRGERTADIVAKVGSQQLYKVLRRYKVKLRRGGWEREPDERMRDRDQAIFDMRANDATVKEIAKAFDMSYQNVCRILGPGSGRPRGRIKGRKST